MLCERAPPTPTHDHVLSCMSHNGTVRRALRPSRPSYNCTKELILLRILGLEPADPTEDSGVRAS